MKTEDRKVKRKGFWTQDTTYTAGSNVSIDASNQISAVLPAIKVDSSTGAITDSSGKSMNVSIFSLISGVTASAVQVSTLANEAAGTYMLSLDSFIPKVATVTSNKSGGKSFS